MSSFLTSTYTLPVHHASTHTPPTQEDTVADALDAVCHLCRWPAGSQWLLLETPIMPHIAALALGRSASQVVRIAALHTAAMVGGAGFGGVQSGMARDELLLGGDAESALQVGCCCVLLGCAL